MDAKSEHTLYIGAQGNCKITGVRDIAGCDEELIEVCVSDKRLSIKGSALNISKLDIDTGILEFSGSIETISYAEQKNIKKKAATLLGRMFK